jgi:hypothetical protein
MIEDGSLLTLGMTRQPQQNTLRATLYKESLKIQMLMVLSNL